MHKNESFIRFYTLNFVSISLQGRKKFSQYLIFMRITLKSRSLRLVFVKMRPICYTGLVTCYSMSRHVVKITKMKGNASIDSFQIANRSTMNLSTYVYQDLEGKERSIW